MVRSCCAVMCGHTGHNCSMKVFPRDEKRAAVWQMNIGRADWKRAPSSAVCECHFDEGQFDGFRPDGTRKLRPDAVPLLFPTHVLVIHDPMGGQEMHDPQPPEPEHPECTDLETKSDQESPQPAPPVKPMPRSLKVKRNQQTTQALQSLNRKPSHPKTKSDQESPQPASPVKPMPRSLKVKRNQVTAQALQSLNRKPFHPMTRRDKRSLRPVPSIKPMPKSIREKRNQVTTQAAKSLNQKPTRPMTRRSQESQRSAKSVKPRPKSVEAKRKVKSSSLQKPLTKSPSVKTPQKPPKQAQPEPVQSEPAQSPLDTPQPDTSESAESLLDMPQPDTPESAESLLDMSRPDTPESTQPEPEEPQQLSPRSLKINQDALSIQMDHDYCLKPPSSKMCEQFCSVEDMEEIEKEISGTCNTNGGSERLQNGFAEAANGSTNSISQSPTCSRTETSPSKITGSASRQTIAPTTRIIINPASRQFVIPLPYQTPEPVSHEIVVDGSNKVSSNINVKSTRNVKSKTRKNDKAKEDSTKKANGNVLFEPPKSIRIDTGQSTVPKITDNVKINGNANVKLIERSVGTKRKAVSLLKPQSKIARTQSPINAPESLVTSLSIDDSPRRKTRSSTSLLKPLPFAKDVATETDPVPPRKPPVSCRDVATETVPMTPPKPPLSSRNVATETDFVLPPRLPKLPSQQFQPPEFQAWDMSDGNEALGSPGLLSDTLSFLQFMLPPKWMALAENAGIHMFLLSGNTSKAIQRSVFVPFTGKDIELHVHAMKLSNKSALFGGCRLETVTLTRESLGDYVDGVVKIVELFNSFKICCGVSYKEYLEDWRNFDDCILDRNLFGEEGYSQTVRSTTCGYLAPKGSERCHECDTL